MKKVLFLLLVTSISYGQALFDKGIKITGGITTANDAAKVVVQSANNVLNTISKSDLVDALYFASASAFPVTGITDRLYIARDNNILYRFNGTIYVPMSADVSGKEDIANKSSSFTASSTVTYANTKALVDGLAGKATGTGTANGTNTGDNATNTQYSGLVTNATHSGDATGSTVLTLATVNANVGSFGTASSVPQYTVNAKGLTTASANVPIAIAQSQVTNLVSDLGLKANLASPTLTGTPTAPTAPAGTSTTQVATTAFVGSAISTADANYMKLTTNQVFSGVKSGNSGTGRQVEFLGATGAINASSFSPSTIPAFYGGAGGTNTVFFAIKTVGSTGSAFQLQGSDTQIKFDVNHLGATTATSFINSTAPAGNVLLAGGGTLANPITGTGTTNFLPKFTGVGTVGNSIVSEVGSEIRVSGNIMLNGTFPYFALKPTAWADSFFFQAGTNLLGNSAGDYALFLNPTSKGFAFKIGTSNSLVIAPNSEVTFSSTVTASNFIATTGTIRLKGFTVATLPAGVIGDTAFVTDALAPSYLVTVMGGGAVATVVFYNGNSWVSH